jgi:hypothetical protein
LSSRRWGRKEGPHRHRDASRLLAIPEATLRQLAQTNRIPARAFPDNEELVLDENELKHGLMFTGDTSCLPMRSTELTLSRGK